MRLGFAFGGKSPGLVALSCGDWTVRTPEVRGARFPDLDRVVPGGVGAASVTLSDADAAFLADRLANLPGAGDERRPVTLQANDGSFLIRAADEGGTPVELATGSSAVRGDAVCVADRRFLAGALTVGCMEITLNGPEEPVRCRTPAGELGPSPAATTLVFAALAGDPVPAKDAVRVAADTRIAATNRRTAPDAVRDIPPTSAPRRTIPVTPTNRLNGHATNGHAADGEHGPDHDAVLARVAALGSTLSEAAGEARSLAADLRKLKKRNRAVTGALAGLKKLASLVA